MSTLGSDQPSVILDSRTSTSMNQWSSSGVSMVARNACPATDELRAVTACLNRAVATRKSGLIELFTINSHRIPWTRESRAPDYQIL